MKLVKDDAGFSVYRDSVSRWLERRRFARTALLRDQADSLDARKAAAEAESLAASIEREHELTIGLIRDTSAKACEGARPRRPGYRKRISTLPRGLPSHCRNSPGNRGSQPQSRRSGEGTAHPASTPGGRQDLLLGLHRNCAGRHGDRPALRSDAWRVDPFAVVQQRHSRPVQILVAIAGRPRDDHHLRLGGNCCIDLTRTSWEPRVRSRRYRSESDRQRLRALR